MDSSAQSKWIYGVAIPLLLVLPGIHGLWTGETIFPAAVHGSGSDIKLNLTGIAAKIMVLTYFNFAAVLHGHFFWKASRPHAAWPDILEKICFILALLGLAYAFLHLFDMLAI